MRVIFVVLIIVSLAVAQRPPAPKTRELLLDFRTDHNPAGANITPSTQRLVFSKVFRRYLTDQNKCSSQFDAGNANDYLAAARKAGQIVPLISDVATGSFTAAGQTQTAYVISVGECSASHADNYGTKRVAIFTGQQLVADFDADFRANIERKVDLNADGIDELLMTSGDMAQGTLIEMAALVTFQNGRLNVIEDFGTVVEDDCATLRPGSTTRASALYFSTSFAPGMMPKLTQDNYVAGCNKAKRWRYKSSGRMTE